METVGIDIARVTVNSIIIELCVFEGEDGNRSSENGEFVEPNCEEQKKKTLFSTKRFNWRKSNYFL